MKKPLWIMVSAVIVIVLGTYITVNKAGQENTEQAEMSDIPKLVEEISTGRTKPQSASISAAALMVTEADGRKVTYDLPEDQFFLSIAPYVQQTHPCEIHSLTGCQGEMADEEFTVTIQDSEGSTLMKNEVLQSGTNGFMDFWVPRDRTYLIRIEQGGKAAETQLSTYQMDQTCITTMQLI